MFRYEIPHFYQETLLFYLLFFVLHTLLGSVCSWVPHWERKMTKNGGMGWVGSLCGIHSARRGLVPESWGIYIILTISLMVPAFDLLLGVPHSPPSLVSVGILVFHCRSICNSSRRCLSTVNLSKLSSANSFFISGNVFCCSISISLSISYLPLSLPLRLTHSSWLWLHLFDCIRGCSINI